MAGLPPEPAPERHQWIVEAKLPGDLFRAVDEDARLSAADPTRLRDEILRELHGYLSSVLEEPPVMLRAAGAIGINATAQEVEVISRHPLIERIQPNRRHHVPP